MPIRLVTDSTCDLPQAVLDRYGIVVVPIYVTLDHQSFRAGVDLSVDEFHRRLTTAHSLPTTASPAENDFAAAYAACGGADVMSLYLGQTFSSVAATGRNAGNRLPAPRRFVAIDSEQLSMGLGWQVLAAAEAAAAGQSLAQIHAVVADIQARLKVLAFLDTLDYVRHGGRLNVFTATLGELLQLKVLVELSHGRVIPRAKLRTRRHAFEKLAEMAEALGPLERLAVMHADCLADAQALAERLAPQSAEPPWIINVSPIVVAHLGPRALGLAAIRA